MRLGLDIGSRLTKIIGTPGEFENDFLMQLLPCNSTGASSFPSQHSLSSEELSVFPNSPGSKTINKSAVILQDIKFYLIDTAKFYINIEKFTELFKDYKISITGYGKNNLQFIKDQDNRINIIPELKAHVNGAVYQTQMKNFTLLDIGGQDTKVIEVINGKMADFITNDKCAASSGRFLENMQNILHINNIGDYFKDPLKLNSTCAVFGESELIGLLSQGISREILAASVNFALYKRVKKLLIKFIKNSDTIVFVGGLSRNSAIRHFITEDLNKTLISPEYPHFNGAIGAYINDLNY